MYKYTTKWTVKRSSKRSLCLAYILCSMIHGHLQACELLEQKSQQKPSSTHTSSFPSFSSSPYPVPLIGMAFSPPI